MTLKQLQKRVNEIVAQNEARWPERNELPVLLDMGRKMKTPRRKHRYFPAEFLMGAQTTVATGEVFACAITFEEGAEVGQATDWRASA